MEYGRREPMKSTSAKEPTAFTMKTIKELLAGEQSERSEAVTQRVPLPQSQVQTPPHLRGGAPIPVVNKTPRKRTDLKASAAPKIDAETTAPPIAMPQRAEDVPAAEVQKASPDQKPRSLLSRIIGGR